MSGPIPQGLLLLSALALAAACSATAPAGSPGAMAPGRGGDASAWTPFQAACEVLDRPQGSCTATTVPAGHRLVIETVSGRMGRIRGVDPMSGPVIQTTVNGAAQRHWLTREFAGTNPTLNLDLYLLTHTLRLYADPATPVVIEAPEAIGSFTISGFLLKLP